MHLPVAVFSPRSATGSESPGTLCFLCYVVYTDVCMSDAQSVVYKLCVDPMPLQTPFENSDQLDIGHRGYDKCKDLEEVEDRKTDNGKAFRHKKVEPTDPLVRLALFNLKSKLGKQSYCQEVRSLQLGDGSGDTLECKVVLAGDEKTTLSREEEATLVQAAIVAPATRWLCGKQQYSWFQTGDVMQTCEHPGVGDLWLCVGWVWGSSHRSLFHYKWDKKGKLPTSHCIMVRLLSVVSYIAEFEQQIVTDPIDLDSFDTASLHFDAVDTCLWVNWWDDFFPLFPHARYIATPMSITLMMLLALPQPPVRLCEFANGCYDWLCEKKGVGTWTLRLPCPKPIAEDAAMTYKYPPDPGLFLTPSGPVDEEEEEGNDEVQEIPPPPPKAPPLKKRSLTTAELKSEGMKGGSKKKKKTSGTSSPPPGSSVGGSELGEGTGASAMSILQEIRTLLKKDDSNAEKRHALCHTNLMAAIAKQFQSLEKVHMDSLTTLQNDLIKALTDVVDSSQGSGGSNVSQSFSSSATTTMLATVTTVVVEKMQEAHKLFHEKLNYNSTVMLDDIRAQTDTVHAAVAHAQDDLSKSLGEQVESVTDDVNTLREEVQSLREMVTAALATRGPAGPVPSFRRQTSTGTTSSYPPVGAIASWNRGIVGVPQGNTPSPTTGTTTSADLFAGGPPVFTSDPPPSSAAEGGGVTTRGKGKGGRRK